jgi:hypothetical protein
MLATMKRFDGGKAMDVVSRGSPTLWILMRNLMDQQQLSDTGIQAYVNQRRTATGWRGYDVVKPQPQVGPYGMRFDPSNYALDVTMTREEELNFSTEEAMMDLAMLKVEQTEEDMAETLAVDLFRGNATNDRLIQGLEQCLYATPQTTAAMAAFGSAANKRWMYRQQDGTTYGTVTRSKFTAADTGGTGIEACTMEGGQDELLALGSNSTVTADTASTGNRFAFSGTNGVPNAALIELQNFFAAMSYQAIHPDIIISSELPYNDYENAITGKQVLQRSKTRYADGLADIGIENLAYKNATWVFDEYALSWNDNGDASAAGEENIYFLNSKHYKLHADSRVVFTLEDQGITPLDQFINVRWLHFRGLAMSDNPRMLGRWFNYGGG